MADDKGKLKFFKMHSDWVAKVRFADPTQSMLERASRITSVNTTGVFIETAMPFPMGSIIQLDITIPGSNEPVAVKGIVRYSNDKTGGKSPRGMAVEFVKGSENLQEIIKEYLQKLQTPPAPPQPSPIQQQVQTPKPVPEAPIAQVKEIPKPTPPPSPKPEPIPVKTPQVVKVEKKIEVAPPPIPQPKKEEVVEKVEDIELEEVLDDIAPEPQKPKVEKKKVEEKKEEEKKAPPPPPPQPQKKKSWDEDNKPWY